MKDGNSDTESVSNQADFIIPHQLWPEELRKFLVDILQLPDEIKAKDIQKDGSLKVIIGTHDMSQLSVGTPSNIWLNALIHRYYIECLQSEILRIRLKAKLMEKLENRLPGSGSIVQSIEVSDIHLGESPPLVSCLRLLNSPDVSNSLDVVLEFDMDYAGGFGVSIVTSLSMGIKIPVTAIMTSFRGRCQLRLPSPIDSCQYAIAFVEDPGVSFSVESSLWRRDNEMMRDVLNNLISKRLKHLFMDLLVLPNWRAFDLPLITYRRTVIPQLEEILDRKSGQPGSRMSASRSESLKRIDLKSGLENSSALNVNTLKESSSAQNPLSTRRRLSPNTLEVNDVLTGICFPTDATVTSSNMEKYNDMLIKQFIKFAEEDNPLHQSSNNDISGSETAGVGIPRNDSPADKWLSTPWENVRNRKEIIVQRKAVSAQGNKADITRGMFKILKCGAEKTFQVLSNPEYLHHVDDMFIDSQVIEKYDDDRCIRSFTYRVARQVRNFNCIEIKKKIERRGKECFIVVYRSIKGFHFSKDSDSFQILETSSRSSDSPSLSFNRPRSSSYLNNINNSKSSPTFSIATESAKAEITNSANFDNSLDSRSIFSSPSNMKSNSSSSLVDNNSILYIFGFLIEPISDSDNSCCVTVLSQFGSPALQRLDINFARCHKTKLFIEELAQWTNLVTSKRLHSDIILNKSDAGPESASHGKRHLLEGDRWRSITHYTEGIKRLISSRVYHRQYHSDRYSKYDEAKEDKDETYASSSGHSISVRSGGGKQMATHRRHRSLSDGNISFEAR